MKKLFSLLSAFGIILFSVGVAMAAEGAAAGGGDSTKAAIALAATSESAAGKIVDKNLSVSCRRSLFDNAYRSIRLVKALIDRNDLCPVNVVGCHKSSRTR